MKQQVNEILDNQNSSENSNSSDKSILKRASLLGNEEPDLVGDSAIFEIEYPNLKPRSIFAKKSNHFCVRIKILVK